MADYEKMYLKMFHAASAAIQLLVDAQRECEEIYVSSPEPNLKLLFPSKEEVDLDGE